MMLQNYLLKLDDPKYIKKGSDSIRIYKLGEVIGQIYKELKKYNSIEQIEYNTGRCEDTHLNWINKKTGISIQELYTLCRYWRISCEKTNKEFEELWNKIYHNSYFFGCTNGKPIKLPKIINYKLAYLIGVIMGDGHLANPSKSYDKLTTYNSEVRITDGNKETFIELSKIFEDLFEYKPNIYSELSKVNKSFYRFVIKSKPLHRFLMVVCNIPTGNKARKICIPKIIRESPLEIQKWFITGFFDADGCVMMAQNKYPQISISQKYVRILNSIIKISENFDIKWNGPYKTVSGNNHGYIIRLSNIKNIEKFLMNFKSINPIKIKQSETLWEKINRSKIYQGTLDA